MEVTALSVDMTNRNLRAISNIYTREDEEDWRLDNLLCITRKRVLHSTAAQSVLERCTHEAVAIASVLQNLEMDGKHGHVKHDRNGNKAQCPCEEVLRK